MRRVLLGHQTDLDSSCKTSYNDLQTLPNRWIRDEVDRYRGVLVAHSEIDRRIVNRELSLGHRSRLDFRRMWRHIVYEMIRFRPGLVIISAGFDAHRADPLSATHLTEDDFEWATTLVLQACEICASRRDEEMGREMTPFALEIEKSCGLVRLVPCMSVLEGGYELSAISASAVKHVKALQEGLCTKEWITHQQLDEELELCGDVNGDATACREIMEEDDDFCPRSGFLPAALALGEEEVDRVGLGMNYSEFKKRFAGVDSTEGASSDVGDQGYVQRYLDEDLEANLLNCLGELDDAVTCYPVAADCVDDDRCGDTLAEDAEAISIIQEMLNSVGTVCGIYRSRDSIGESDSSGSSSDEDALNIRDDTEEDACLCQDSRHSYCRIGGDYAPIADDCRTVSISHVMEDMGVCTESIKDEELNEVFDAMLESMSDLLF